MDEIREEIRRKICEARRTAAFAEGFAEGLQECLSRLDQGFPPRPQAPAPTDLRPVPSAAGSAAPAAQDQQERPTFTCLVLDILRDAGTPLTINDIQGTLARKGTHLTRDQVKNTLQRLCFQELVKRHGAGAYKVAGLGTFMGA